MYLGENFGGGNLKKSDNLQDVYVNGRIILKQILRKENQY
jgi:hypothetical protein